MICLILDVHYKESQETDTITATVAGIRFESIEQSRILSEHIVEVNDVSPYESQVSSINEKCLAYWP